MKIIIFLLSIITSSLTYANDEVVFDSQIAVDKAKILLREFAFNSGYTINKDTLNKEATVLAGIDKEGKKIVKVLFPDKNGAYETTFIINKDGWLILDTVGETAYTIEAISKRFKEAPYTVEY